LTFKFSRTTVVSLPVTRHEPRYAPLPPSARVSTGIPALDVVTPFQDTHHGTREMTVHDPDGRL